MLKFLFLFLKKIRLATPSQISPYIEHLHPEMEIRPVAQQIVDQLLTETSSFYAIYAESRLEYQRRNLRTADRPDQKPAELLGVFMSRWISFERLLRELARINDVDFVSPTTGWLRLLGVFEESDLTSIDSIRRLRNQVVHGREAPEPQYLRSAIDALDRIMASLAADTREDVRRVASSVIDLEHPLM